MKQKRFKQGKSVTLTTNRIDSANAKISATITQDQIDQKVNDIAKRLSKEVNIPGFRKGKTPPTAIKKQYGERLVQDAESETFRDVLDLGLQEMRLSNDVLLGEPQVSKYDKQESQIDVEVTLAIRPEVPLDDYSDLLPAYEKPTATDEEINARIAELAAMHAPFVDVDEDRVLVDGDTANINFSGSIEGVKFEGGSAENHSLTLGSGQFIPGFEEQVVGMKKGDSKDITVTFPQEYQNEELKGKEAVFAVTVNAIQTKEVPEIDDELAKKLLPGDEEASLEKLKEKVKEQLESEAFNKLFNDELKPKLLESLVEKYTFDLPESVVEQELDMAVNKKAQEMSEEELKAVQEDAEKLKSLRETFRDDATKSVRATFIIDSLAKKEGVEVPEQEVMQTIYYEAMQMGQDPAQVYDQYKESGYLPAIQMAMVEDKVLNKILTQKEA